MPYTQADLAAVRAEMLAPESVSFADRSVRRRSMAELQQLEQAIIADLSAVTNPAPRSKQTLGVSSKGF